MEKASHPDALTEDEIEIIAYISAKIDRRLRAIRKKYKNPKEYSKSIAKLFSHKDNIIAISLLYNIGNLDPNALYKPEDLRKTATQQFQGDVASNNLDIEPKDVNRALEELDREIGLDHFDTKEKLKQIQRIKLSGRPSAYRLSSEVSILKTVSSKPILSQLIIRNLKRMGLVDNLVFQLESSFYLLTKDLHKDNKENTIHLFISAAKSSPIQLKDGESYESSLQAYAKLLSSIDDEMIPKLAKEMAERFVEIPELCYPLLLSFLSKST